MANLIWQPEYPFDAIIFDCDGTLSEIEGIDELARFNSVEDVIEELTAEAMGKTGLNPEVYEKRLQIVNPTLSQLLALGREYVTHLSPHATNVVEILRKFDKTIYLVSAGLFPAIAMLGAALQIPEKNIFGVNIKFNESGNYLDFERDSPLIQNKGKRIIIDELKAKHEAILYVGDGLNDLAVCDQVARFVGYGGKFYRQNIADMCDFYIQTRSFTPLLPLSLIRSEVEELSQDEINLYIKGLEAIDKNLVKINSK